MICMYTFFVSIDAFKQMSCMRELHCLCEPHVCVGQTFNRDGEKLASPRERKKKDLV